MMDDVEVQIHEESRVNTALKTKREVDTADGEKEEGRDAEETHKRRRVD
jgi:hypothetical protein